MRPYREKPCFAVVMHGGYDRRRDRAWSDVEWFLRDGRHWRRHHERVDEVAWTSTEIRATLRDAGFDRIRARDATPFFKGVPNMRPGCRTIYLAYLARKAGR